MKKATNDEPDSGICLAGVIEEVSEASYLEGVVTFPAVIGATDYYVSIEMNNNIDDTRAKKKKPGVLECDKPKKQSLLVHTLANINSVLTTDGENVYFELWKLPGWKTRRSLRPGNYKITIFAGDSEKNGSHATFKLYIEQTEARRVNAVLPDLAKKNLARREAALENIERRARHELALAVSDQYAGSQSTSIPMRLGEFFRPLTPSWAARLFS